MPLDRREFVQLVVGGIAASTWRAPLATAVASRQRVRAVAFDAFPIFDPRPILGLAEALFPGKGMELSNAWRTRQFEYQWLRTLSGHYADFWQTTEDGLVFAARQLRLDLTPDRRDQLMQAWLGLKAWPDVRPALGALKTAGLRLALLSNMTAKMLETGIGNSGLEGNFDHVLSTDTSRAHKPDPRAYRMAVDAFGLERGEIVFAAFAAWDVAGARWFGYPTFWVNRLDVPAEELGVGADGTGRGLDDLVRFVEARR
jgi:2-haloacid dehalogenase